MKACKVVLSGCLAMFPSREWGDESLAVRTEAEGPKHRTKGLHRRLYLLGNGVQAGIRGSDGGDGGGVTRGGGGSAGEEIGAVFGKGGSAVLLVYA